MPSVIFIFRTSLYSNFVFLSLREYPPASSPLVSLHLWHGYGAVSLKLAEDHACPLLKIPFPLAFSGQLCSPFKLQWWSFPGSLGFVRLPGRPQPVALHYQSAVNLLHLGFVSLPHRTLTSQKVVTISFPQEIVSAGYIDVE